MVELENQNYNVNKSLYAEIEKLLRQHLKSGTPIDHVGSTALPNIVGKNIIDVLVGAKDSKEFAEYREIISSLGYFPSKNSKTDIYQFFASKEGETASGDSHIHLVIIDTERYREFLILRDYLLACPQEAIDYSNHKKQLLSQGIVDRKAYRATKSEYVTALIARAKQYKSKI